MPGVGVLSQENVRVTNAALKNTLSHSGPSGPSVYEFALLGAFPFCVDRTVSSTEFKKHNGVCGRGIEATRGTNGGAADLSSIVSS